MKRIDVNSTGKNDNRHPFWMPWGFGGSLWRYLLFLILLVLFCLLLASLKGCYRHSARHSSENDEYFRDFPSAVEIPEYRDVTNPELRDIIDSPNGETPFDGNIDNRVIELPAPDDNRLIDIPDDDIITNPSDPFKQIASTRLNVILDSESGDETFNTFATKLKQVHPECEINYYNKITKLIQITVPAERRVYIHDNLNREIPDISFKVFYEEILAASASASDHNDPAFNNKDQSWYFAPIQAYDAWEITKGSPEIVVAVIDNYIDVTHPELEGRITLPYSVERQSKNVLPPAGVAYSFDDPNSDIYHGTHVAATAVGALDNNQGTAGIAPLCTLMPISVGGQISSMKILDAILYAINQGADVINLSLGNYYPEEIVEGTSAEEQIEYARNEGKYVQDIWDYVFNLADERNCTIVWAGGNQGVITGMDEFKRNPATVRVSAVDSSLRRTDFSNYGRYDNMGINYSDISAPGVKIYNAGPGNAYGFCDGTSMSAPIVTGAIALMKSVNPKLTNKEIIEILNATARPLPESDHAGGLIQIRDALDRVGGSVANFDEIKEDNNKILGNWETTELQTVNIIGTDDTCLTHIFLHFDSPQHGTITYKEDSGNNYSAPFTSQILNDRIEIKQNGKAKSRGQEDWYVEISFIGRRGPNGMLECRRDNGATFYLIRRA